MQKLLLGIIIIGLVVQCHQNKTEADQKVLPDKTVKASIMPIRIASDAFGINVNKYEVQDFSVQKNESLYLLLKKMNLDESEIYEATQKAKKVFDVRSFKPKQTYRAYVSKANNELKKMVWEPNEVDYVTFDWQQDSLQIYSTSRVVTKKTKQISGEITSSLYNAISDKNARDELVYKMSEIFAWQVDFFNLRKGDTFKILFENKFVEDQFYDVGEILAVELKHRGEPFFAYRFQKGDFDGYFDEEGQSVQKALLKAPFTYDHRISSSFNRNRFHPILKRRIPHNGIDYAAPYGTRVLSVGDGIVTRARYSGAAGRMVKVKHNGTFETAYMHLSRFAKGVREGTHVKQGEVVGYVGKSGRVTGTHLHYSMYKDKRPINPLNVDLPPSKAIPKKYIADFNKLRNDLNIRLLEKDAAGRNLPTTIPLSE
jgi:murein DD-endopeptidase MepM/ murein hydrolase activator NlpD